MHSHGLLLQYATLVGPAVEVLFVMSFGKIPKHCHPFSRKLSIVGVLNVGGSPFSSLCLPGIDGWTFASFAFVSL